MKQQQKVVRALLTDLKSCSMRRNLQWGRRIHAKLVESGNDWNLHVVTALIKMYGKCGSMVDAHRVFDTIDNPDVVSWTALLLGYAENGEGLAALKLFSRMKVHGCVPDPVTYLAALKACTSLAVKGDGNGCLNWGRQIHNEIGCHLTDYVQSALIDMYAKCGSMEEARHVFDSMKEPDVVTWTALLLGYAENGEGRDALELFSRMKANGCVPNSVTYIAVLKACTSVAVKGDRGILDGLERGRQIHSEIGCHLDLYVQSTLIDMYSKCGSMAEARHVFENIKQPNVVSWNALLLGYVENGEGFAGLELFSRMKMQGCLPNSLTYIGVLKACVLLGALPVGRKVHLEINEFTSNLLSSLVDFYAKCGSMVEAQQVFDQHARMRNLATWNALLAGYGSYGDTGPALGLFEAMQDAGFWPNAVTFVCMLLCCGHAGLVHMAREFFEAMPMQYGITPSIVHYTCMVDVLGRANHLNEVIVMLRRMPCDPDAVTWRALLGACCKWKNVEIGAVAFQFLVDMEEKDAAAYILMAHIYGTRGMWEEQEMVLQMRIMSGAGEVWGQAYVTDKSGKILNFVVGEPDLPEVEEGLKQLCESMKGHGYVVESVRYDSQCSRCWEG